MARRCTAGLPSFFAYGQRDSRSILPGVDPMKDPRCAALCADRKEVLARLRGSRRASWFLGRAVARRRTQIAGGPTPR
jgi:hypothetical protein